MVRFIPTAKGRDLYSRDQKFDAHVRIEHPARMTRRVIAVDVFNAKVKDSTRAHVESEFFTLSPRGAKDAADFLLGYGFEATLRLPRR